MEQKIKNLTTVVYIDGFNLYYSLKRTPYKWLDVKNLSSSILQKHHNILKVKYFSARVKSLKKDDLSQAERQSAYWRALQSVPEVEIVEGCFKKREVKGKLLTGLKKIPKKNIVKIEKYEEKESDVNIASHIVWDSSQKDIDCIVLLSNDTDLKMPLSIARKKFHKKIGIISPLRSKNSY